MRVLVTGGFGFLGAHLARHLRASGHVVRLGSRKPIRPAWLPDAELAQICWDDENSLTAACKGIELVVHAAGMNAPDCAKDPAGALQFNGVATARLVNAAAKAGTHRFIYLSTAHVYASPIIGRLDEQCCPRNLHPYASSHLAGENALLHATALGRLKGMVLRLSNVFGAPVMVDANCWMLLFNDLCREAVTHRRMTLRSDPAQLRDFITMADAIRAIAWLIQLDSDHAQAVFNVGSGCSKSLLEVAQAIQDGCLRMLGYVPELRLLKYGSTMPAPLDYRIDKLLATGFTPENNVAAEIDDILDLCQGRWNGNKIPPCPPFTKGE